MADAKSTRSLRPGDAFIFPIGDGRFSVCRIIHGADSEPAKRWSRKLVMAACSSWIGQATPAAGAPELRKVILKSHHSWNQQPALIWTGGPVPKDFKSIDAIPPSEEDLKLDCNSFGDWGSITVQPLAQWRWDRDRQAVLNEDTAKRRLAAETRQKLRQEREAYLGRVTLEDLREHTFFPKWKNFPPAEAIEASRRIMSDTVDRLLDLGGTRSSKQKMKILKECIEAFNPTSAVGRAKCPWR